MHYLVCAKKTLFCNPGILRVVTTLTDSIKHRSRDG